MPARAAARGKLAETLALSARALLAAAFTVAAVVPVARAARVERIEVFRGGGWLYCEVGASDLLDARTRSTVESGLPGFCSYRFDVREEGGGSVGTVMLTLRLRLDLWAGLYLLSGPQGELSLPTLAAADSACSHPARVRLLPLSRLQPARSYRLRVEITVEPLGGSDQARISRYVRQSSGEAGDEFALNVGGLLGRFLGGAQRQPRGAPGESAPFRWSDLREVP
jgi:hypothetical protein